MPGAALVRKIANSCGVEWRSGRLPQLSRDPVGVSCRTDLGVELVGVAQLALAVASPSRCATASPLPYRDLVAWRERHRQIFLFPERKRFRRFWGKSFSLALLSAARKFRRGWWR